MNVTDVSPVRTDQPEYALALECLFVLVTLFSFIRVASYTMRQARQHTLVGGAPSPLVFPIEPAVGWLFAFSIMVLVFAQNPLYYVMVPVGMWVFLAAAQRSAEYQFGLGRLDSYHLVQWILVVCGAFFFVELPLGHVVDRAMTWLQVPHPAQQAVETFDQIRRPDEIVIFIFNAVFIGPFIEELFFRGFLYSFLKRFTTVWGALILSAGVFAFAHANLGSVLQLWLLGVVLGVAYEHTGSLLLPMGIHGCFNLISAITLLIEKNSS